MAAAVQCMTATLGSNNPYLYNTVFFYDANHTLINSYKCNGITPFNLFPTSPFELSNIDPVLIAGAVGAGFFCLVPLWAAVLGFSKLVSVVRG